MVFGVLRLCGRGGGSGATVGAPGGSGVKQFPNCPPCTMRDMKTDALVYSLTIDLMRVRRHVFRSSTSILSVFLFYHDDANT